MDYCGGFQRYNTILVYHWDYRKNACIVLVLNIMNETDIEQSFTIPWNIDRKSSSIANANATAKLSARVTSQLFLWSGIGSASQIGIFSSRAAMILRRNCGSLAVGLNGPERSLRSSTLSGKLESCLQGNPDLLSFTHVEIDRGSELDVDTLPRIPTTHISELTLWRNRARDNGRVSLILLSEQ
jgi:hypothetical protein